MLMCTRLFLRFLFFIIFYQYSSQESNCMKNESISVLLIEDSLGDSKLITDMLSESRDFQFSFKQASRIKTGRELLLRGKFDIVLLDLNLPDSFGVSSAATFIQDFPDIPIIIITNHDNEEAGVNAVKMGAQDYIVKFFTDSYSLIRSVIYAIERKKLERQYKSDGINTSVSGKLKTAEAELEKTRKELKNFLYVVSHDLHEPVRSISSFSQILQRKYRDKMDTDANTYIDFIIDGTVNIQKMLDDLLTFSRITPERTFITEVDTTAVVESVLNKLSSKIKSQQASIVCENLPVIQSDYSQIKELFLHLLSNALTYTSENPVRISVSAVKKDSEWIFSITDNGIGIEKEFFDRIFIMFQRLHTREEYPGTGMGLTICKQIIELHGGRIWLESELMKGTTFFFSLPEKTAS